MVQWCWVTFQCRGVLLILIRVGQGPTALAVGAGGGCLDIFSLVCHFSFLSPSLWEMARYRLKYHLKRPLSPKQPINPACSSAIISSAWGLSLFKITFSSNGSNGGSTVCGSRPNGSRRFGTVLNGSRCFSTVEQPSVVAIKLLGKSQPLGILLVLLCFV